MTDYQALKRSVTIPQVLERYGFTTRLRRSGDGWRGHCPIRHGQNPTQFHVTLVTNCWVCFGDCHQGGSVLDFVRITEQVSLPEAARLLKDWFGSSHEIRSTVRPVS